MLPCTTTLPRGKLRPNPRSRLTMSTQTVRQACKISDLVERDDLVEQIANLEGLNDPAGLDAGEFFRRNHFTEGVPVGNLIRLATEAESRNASAL